MLRPRRPCWGIRLVPVEVDLPDQLDTAFQAYARERVERPLAAALRRVLLDRLEGDETRLPPGLMSALEAKRTCWDGVMT
jgi:hypothetical protein